MCGRLFKGLLGFCFFILAGCGGGAGEFRSPSQPGAPLVPQTKSSSLTAGNFIKHIVIIVQENRSFDNLFAGFPGANAPTFGFTHTGAFVPLRPISLTSSDMGHGWSTAVTSWDNGRMDGFDLNVFANAYGGTTPAGTYPYAYVKRALVAPYWQMANQYVLADHMFPTEMGGSFTAHLDLIAGSTNLTSTTAEVDQPTNLPWGCDAPAGTTTDILSSAKHWSNNGPAPCFSQITTVAALLDGAGVSWKYYVPTGPNGGSYWSQFDAIQSIRYGPDWARNIVSPETTVLNDVAAGALPSVSWVIPDFANSDHAGADGNTGPSWVTAVVNAVGKSKYWSSTAIIVVWDDWGGWYDNVPPPQPDFLGLGIRVPCIIISPYAKRHYVSHTQYEFGSILKFTEELYGLPSLGVTDARSNSLLDSFDLSRPARAFRPISAPYASSFFRHQRHSLKPPDTE